ncbi:MAG: endo-1,4-beta-xylanase [Oscillospiraceae bacterium]|nr:endo-1,4-beta-xylanase [Oscillospiraceae bacterium]
MKKKRISAVLTAAACVGSMLATMPFSAVQAATIVSNDFEVTYGGWYADSPDNSAKVTAIEGIGFDGSRGMKITGRTSPADGAESEKDLYLEGGKSYDYSVRVFAENDQTFKLTLTTVDTETEEETVKVLDEQFVKGGTWAELSATYTAPEKSKSFKLNITTDTTDDFIYDDVKIVGEQEIVAYAASQGIKDALANKGMRSGNILNGTTVNDSGIKNILLKDCNAIECENETKPDATLVASGSSNTNIQVTDRSFAKIADWCAQNGLGFRGHTMVWHSQTPEWFFKENMSGNSGNYVNESTMNQRLQSYITNMFNMYAEKYPTLDLYAYDICNECMNDSNGGPRNPGYNNGNSPWVKIYGDNHFIDKAFEYARAAAPKTCKLFYNDYNEYASFKRDAIATTASRIHAAGNLDGVGMQSHINANMNDGWSGQNAYVTAMKKYLGLGLEVQITELDISVDGGKYSYQQQADRYAAILKEAVTWNEEHPNGAHVTLFQVWGPNDGHSWLSAGSNALLYDSNNQPKAAYTAVMGVVPQSEWGDGSKVTNTPVEVKEPEVDSDGYWFHYTFENGTESFTGRSNDMTLTSSSAKAYKGSKSLYVTGRSESWHGAVAPSLNSRIFKAGETYSFSTAVMNADGASTETMHFTLEYTNADGDTDWVKIASGDAPKGEWVQLANDSFTFPSGSSGYKIYVECDGETTSYYVDEMIAAPSGTTVAGPGKAAKFVLGDLDGDEAITAKDLTLAKRGLKSGLSGRAASAADVDDSGEFDANDVKYIHQFITKQITKFPVAERKVNFDELDKAFSSISLAKSWKYDNENNPLTTQRFGADPGWMVYDGRLYIYTTNDAFEYVNGSIRDNEYEVRTINCISTDDMVNWTDHGAIPVAYDQGRLPDGAAKWAARSWAPDAAWKMVDGKPKFFLYFANNGSGVGVLTSDSPTGPWKDPIGKELISRSTPNCGNVAWLFDPGVYYDEATDEAWIMFGGGKNNNDGTGYDNPKTGRCAKLGKDMVSIDGGANTMETPYLFEDSSLIKIGDTWYYSYCANWNVPGGTRVNGVSFGNADILYMCSKDPKGPWTSAQLKGMVFANTGSQRIDNGGNNHHSIIYYKDEYYVAYHSRQQEMRMNGGKDRNYRSTQINKATYNASNGTITCSGDMKGVSQIQNLDPYKTVEAETMAQQAGIEISGVGNTVVTKIDKGDWIKVKGVDFANGSKKFTVKASSKNGAHIKVCVGKPDASTGFAYAEIPSGGSMKELTFDCLNVKGVNDICFVFDGECEFDSWSFS